MRAYYNAAASAQHHHPLFALCSGEEDGLEQLLRHLAGDLSPAELNALSGDQLADRDVIAVHVGRCFCAQEEAGTKHRQLIRQRIRALESELAMEYLHWCWSASSRWSICIGGARRSRRRSISSR
jgi:hypothetical protein